MKKKYLILTTAIIGIMLVLVGCGNSSTKAEKSDNGKELTKIKVGYNGGVCTSSLGLADSLKIYEKYGLEPEFVNTESLVDAIGTGKVDVVQSHIAELTAPAVNGVNIVFTSGVHTGCKSLFVLKDSGIAKTSDLIGKAIAIPSGIGGSDHNIALRMLNNDNIEPDKITWKTVETSIVVQGLQNGDVQAALLSDQFAKKFVDEGTLVPIRSITTDEDFNQEPCCVTAINADFADKNSEVAKNITLALDETLEYMEKNKAEAAKLISERDWGSGDESNDLAFLETLKFGIDDKTTEHALRSVIDDYKKFKILDDEHSTDDLIDLLWKPQSK